MDPVSHPSYFPGCGGRKIKVSRTFHVSDNSFDEQREGEGGKKQGQGKQMNFFWKTFFSDSSKRGANLSLPPTKAQWVWNPLRRQIPLG